MNFAEGEILLIYKPVQWTSFDVVKKIRNLICKHADANIKIGHAGTLDPLADGLMILCTGKKTKEIEKYQAREKEYIAYIKLGATTPSFDCETEEDFIFPFEHIDDVQINELPKLFIGEQKQLPPVFSAKKVNGQRAYKKARKGIEVTIEPSLIHIYELEIISFSNPDLVIRVKCSKGTYIRSLARDIGKTLNSGAYLTGLKRTKIGEFDISQCLSLEKFKDILFPDIDNIIQ